MTTYAVRKFADRGSFRIDSRTLGIFAAGDLDEALDIRDFFRHLD